ncbi:MAG: zinc ribbon domain-containing protein [Lachnospiraceae bacterium]|nr:zinc ribbon domain-containing protein [Lachnospiraceae bacterium]
MQRIGNHPLYGHLFCAECGAPFKRRTLTNSCGHYKAWNCAERQKGKNGNGCRNMVWKEEVLTDAVCGLLGYRVRYKCRDSHSSIEWRGDGEREFGRFKNG